MAVFLINICKFNGCGITFPSLGSLIQHIEDTHIDYDPKVVEQKEQAQPACLPLSYVLRFISEDARKTSFLSTNSAGAELKRKLAIKHHSYSMSSSNRSNTPTGSEMDEDEMVVSESEDSNDSWTTEEFSSEFIMRYGSRHSGSGSNGTPGNEKPFACPVPGCKKRYKNVNGIKYHSKNGHKKDGKVRKGYKCHCGKSYKTAQGLKSHALATHNPTTENGGLHSQQVSVACINNSSGGILMQRSASPSQSLGSLSPSSISNMSSSASSCHGSSTSTQNSSNVLQHLTNGVVSGIGSNCSTNTCLTSATSGCTSITVSNSSLNGPQLQFSSSAVTSNNNNSINGQQNVQSPATVAAVTTETTSSPLYCGHMLSSSSTTATTTKSTAMNTTAITAALHLNQANNIRSMKTQSGSTSVLNQSNQMQTQTAPMGNNPAIYYPNPTTQISPTFIEHKYSAHVFKQKFFSNLRPNHQHNNNKINYSVIQMANGQNMESTSAPAPSVVTSTTARVDDISKKIGNNSSSVIGICSTSCKDDANNSIAIDDVRSIQEQFNENYQNFSKKSIN